MAMEPSLRTRDTDLQKCDSKECTLPETHEGLCDPYLPVTFTYTNWKGRQAKRKVCPTGQVKHCATEWHKVPQWIFEAIDCEDGKQKLFAFSGINAGRDSVDASIRMRWYRG